MEFMIELSNTLSDYMVESKNKLKKTKISVKRNEIDGYHLSMSKARAEILKANLDNLDSITIKDIEIKIEELKFNTRNKNNVKITIPFFDKNKKEVKSEDYEEEDYDDNEDDHNKLIELVTNYYYLELEKIYLNYGKYIKKV